jgi:TetR/AcrR family transcriptional regulator
LSNSTKPLSASERRSTTIEAAVRLAGEQNPTDVTTAEIAARMGLTQPALFRHFASKDAIWEGVMDWVSERLLANLERASASAASPLAALEAAFLAHVDFVARHSGVPRILLAELQRAEDTPAKRMVRTLLRRYGERIRALVELGRARGEIAPETDVEAATTLFVGTIQGLVVSSLLSGRVSRLRQDAPGAFAIFLRGIRSGR